MFTFPKPFIPCLSKLMNNILQISGFDYLSRRREREEFLKSENVQSNTRTQLAQQSVQTSMQQDREKTAPEISWCTNLLTFPLDENNIDYKIFFLS